MASFTDNIQALSTFNPYVQDLPVDAMVKVGMAKQQKYEEGVQKIQTSIDNIAGLDIYKDSDKAYIQSKINELGNNLKVFAAGDFSDFQLVNSVNGMTNQIVKDEKVQSAVSATASAKKELSFMEEQRKAGKSSPSNEAVFKKKFASWADNEEIGQSFNAKYDPFFDIWKYAKETFDAIKPDQYSFDQIYVTGEDDKPILGKDNKPILSPYMKRLEKEGYFPETVKNTLNQIFSDPRVSKQLSIDGQYNLSGLDENDLKQRIITKKDEEITSYNDLLFDLNLKKSMGIDTKDQIDKLTERIQKTNSSYDDLLATKDLDSIRGTLYRQDTYDRYTHMFGTLKTKEQAMDNPAFKMNFELNKEANRRQEEAIKHAFEVHKLEVDEKWKEKNYNLEVIKANTAAAKKGGTGTSPIDGTGFGLAFGTDRPLGTDRTDIAMADYKYTQAANNFSTSQDDFIFKTIFENQKGVADQIAKIRTNNPGDTPLTDKQAISIFLKAKAKEQKISIGEFRARQMTSALQTWDSIKDKKNVDPRVKDSYYNTAVAQKMFDNESLLKKTRDDSTNLILKSVGLDKDFEKLTPQTVTYRGQKITLSKQNQIDMAAYLAGNVGILSKIPGLGETEAVRHTADVAKRNLEKQGLGELAERYLQTVRALKANPVGAPFTKAVGLTSSAWSTIGDAVDYFQGKPTDAFSGNMPDLLTKLGWSIYNKAYSKVTDNQSKIIKTQYSIKPDRGAPLLTGDAETDRGIKYQLNDYVSAFTGDGAVQNLAPKDQFENFQESLNKDDSKYNIVSETDKNGNPVWAVESRDKDGSTGKMYLNPDQSKKLGYDAADIFEADNVNMMKSRMSLYNGKTCVGDPTDIYTYKNNTDYVYSKESGDFPRIKNPNITVRANVVNYDGRYYTYLYMNDGKKESVINLPGLSNLAQVDASIRDIDESQIKSTLK